MAVAAPAEESLRVLFSILAGGWIEAEHASCIDVMRVQVVNPHMLTNENVGICQS